MPRHGRGLAMRTHRVRPSEKTASRVVPRPLPARQAALGSASPRRGGLCTPANEALLPPEDRPFRRSGDRLPPMIMLCLGLRMALPRGRTECVPPRKPPFALCQGFRRKAIPAWIASCGGAGSARPQGRPRLDRGMCPLGHRLIVNPSGGNGMPRLADGLATRTHGVRPSEETTFRVMPGFSPQGHPGLDSLPADGRAPHARNEGIGFTRACPL